MDFKGKPCHGRGLLYYLRLRIYEQPIRMGKLLR